MHAQLRQVLGGRVSDAIGPSGHYGNTFGLRREDCGRRKKEKKKTRVRSGARVGPNEVTKEGGMPTGAVV